MSVITNENKVQSCARPPTCKYEKARRDRLNLFITKLSTFLPKQSPAKSLSKIDVLEKIVHLIKCLLDDKEKLVNKNCTDESLRQELKELRSTVSNLKVRIVVLNKILKEANIAVPLDLQMPHLDDNFTPHLRYTCKRPVSSRTTQTDSIEHEPDARETRKESLEKEIEEESVEKLIAFTKKLESPLQEIQDNTPKKTETPLGIVCQVIPSQIIVVPYLPPRPAITQLTYVNKRPISSYTDFKILYSQEQQQKQILASKKRKRLKPKMKKCTCQTVLLKKPDGILKKIIKLCGYKNCKNKTKFRKIHEAAKQQLKEQTQLAKLDKAKETQQVNNSSEPVLPTHQSEVYPEQVLILNTHINEGKESDQNMYNKQESCSNYEPDITKSSYSCPNYFSQSNISDGYTINNTRLDFDHTKQGNAVQLSNSKDGLDTDNITHRVNSTVDKSGDSNTKEKAARIHSNIHDGSVIENETYTKTPVDCDIRQCITNKEITSKVDEVDNSAVGSYSINNVIFSNKSQSETMYHSSKDINANAKTFNENHHIDKLKLKAKEINVHMQKESVRKNLNFSFENLGSNISDQIASYPSHDTVNVSSVEKSSCYFESHPSALHFPNLPSAPNIKSNHEIKQKNNTSHDISQNIFEVNNKENSFDFLFGKQTSLNTPQKIKGKSENCLLSEKNFLLEEMKFHSEFSNDLFTLPGQVGCVSPTAAFLLTFPVVSSKQDNMDTGNAGNTECLSQDLPDFPFKSNMFYPSCMSTEIVQNPVDTASLMKEDHINHMPIPWSSNDHSPAKKLPFESVSSDKVKALKISNSEDVNSKCSQTLFSYSGAPDTKTLVNWMTCTEAQDKDKTISHIPTEPLPNNKSIPITADHYVPVTSTYCFYGDSNKATIPLHGNSEVAHYNPSHLQTSLNMSNTNVSNAKSLVNSSSTVDSNKSLFYNIADNKTCDFLINPKPSCANTSSFLSVSQLVEPSAQSSNIKSNSHLSKKESGFHLGCNNNYSTEALLSPDTSKPSKMRNKRKRTSSKANKINPANFSSIYNVTTSHNTANYDPYFLGSNNTMDNWNYNYSSKTSSNNADISYDVVGNKQRCSESTNYDSYLPLVNQNFFPPAASMFTPTAKVSHYEDTVSSNISSQSYVPVTSFTPSSYVSLPQSNYNKKTILNPSKERSVTNMNQCTHRNSSASIGTQVATSSFSYMPSCVPVQSTSWATSISMSSSPSYASAKVAKSSFIPISTPINIPKNPSMSSSPPSRIAIITPVVSTLSLISSNNSTLDSVANKTTSKSSLLTSSYTPTCSFQSSTTSYSSSIIIPAATSTTSSYNSYLPVTISSVIDTSVNNASHSTSSLISTSTNSEQKSSIISNSTSSRKTTQSISHSTFNPTIAQSLSYSPLNITKSSFIASSVPCNDPVSSSAMPSPTVDTNYLTSIPFLSTFNNAINSSIPYSPSQNHTVSVSKTLITPLTPSKSILTSFNTPKTSSVSYPSSSTNDPFISNKPYSRSLTTPINSTISYSTSFTTPITSIVSYSTSYNTPTNSFTSYSSMVNTPITSTSSSTSFRISMNSEKSHESSSFNTSLKSYPSSSENDPLTSKIHYSAPFTTPITSTMSYLPSFNTPANSFTSYSSTSSTPITLTSSSTSFNATINSENLHVSSLNTSKTSSIPYPSSSTNDPITSTKPLLNTLANSFISYSHSTNTPITSTPSLSLNTSINLKKPHVSSFNTSKTSSISYPSSSMNNPISSIISYPTSFITPISSTIPYLPSHNVPTNSFISYPSTDNTSVSSTMPFSASFNNSKTLSKSHASSFNSSKTSSIPYPLSSTNDPITSTKPYSTSFNTPITSTIPYFPSLNAPTNSLISYPLTDDSPITSTISFSTSFNNSKTSSKTHASSFNTSKTLSMSYSLTSVNDTSTPTKCYSMSFNTPITSTIPHLPSLHTPENALISYPSTGDTRTTSTTSFSTSFNNSKITSKTHASSFNTSKTSSMSYSLTSVNDTSTPTKSYSTSFNTPISSTIPHLTSLNTRENALISYPSTGDTQTTSKTSFNNSKTLSKSHASSFNTSKTSSTSNSLSSTSDSITSTKPYSTSFNTPITSTIPFISSYNTPVNSFISYPSTANTSITSTIPFSTSLNNSRNSSLPYPVSLNTTSKTSSKSHLSFKTPTKASVLFPTLPDTPIDSIIPFSSSENTCRNSLISYTSSLTAPMTSTIPYSSSVNSSIVSTTPYSTSLNSQRTSSKSYLPPKNPTISTVSPTTLLNTSSSHQSRVNGPVTSAMSYSTSLSNEIKSSIPHSSSSTAITSSLSNSSFNTPITSLTSYSSLNAPNKFSDTSFTLNTPITTAIPYPSSFDAPMSSTITFNTPINSSISYPTSLNIPVSSSIPCPSFNNPKTSTSYLPLTSPGTSLSSSNLKNPMKSTISYTPSFIIPTTSTISNSLSLNTPLDSSVSFNNPESSSLEYSLPISGLNSSISYDASISTSKTFSNASYSCLNNPVSTTISYAPSFSTSNTSFSSFNIPATTLTTYSPIHIPASVHFSNSTFYPPVTSSVTDFNLSSIFPEMDVKKQTHSQSREPQAQFKNHSRGKHSSK